MKLIILLLLSILVIVYGCEPDEDDINTTLAQSDEDIVYCYKVKTFVASNNTDTNNLVFYTITVGSYAHRDNSENVNRVTNFVLKTQEDIIYKCNGVNINPHLSTREDVINIAPLVYSKQMSGYILDLYIEFYLYRSYISSSKMNKNISIIDSPFIDKTFETCAFNILIENAISSDIEVGRTDDDNAALAFIIIGSVVGIVLFIWFIINCYYYTCYISNNTKNKEKEKKSINKINEVNKIYERLVKLEEKNKEISNKKENNEIYERLKKLEENNKKEDNKNIKIILDKPPVYDNEESRLVSNSLYPKL